MAILNIKNHMTSYQVNPLAINSPSLNVFTENARVITMIDSPEFGPVAYIAIGATLVGSIILTCHEGDVLKRYNSFFLMSVNKTVLNFFLRR